MHKSFPIAWAVVAGLAFSMAATAQSSPPADGSSQSGQSARKGIPDDQRVVKPGDRTCLRSTGSLIPAKNGACLPVTGRSYGGDELRRTGYNDTGRALEALDPSVSIGH